MGISREQLRFFVDKLIEIRNDPKRGALWNSPIIFDMDTLKSGPFEFDDNAYYPTDPRWMYMTDMLDEIADDRYFIEENKKQGATPSWDEILDNDHVKLRGFPLDSLLNYRKYRLEEGDNEPDTVSAASEGKDKEPVSLSGKEVSFNEGAAKIMIGEYAIDTVVDTKQSLLTKTMFEYAIGEWTSWDEVCEIIKGEAESVDPAKDHKMIKDAALRINKKIQDITGTKDELFTCDNKNIRRNF